MKTINLSEVRDKIRELVQTGNFVLQDDVVNVVNEMKDKEESPAGRAVFDQILENAQIANSEKLGLCQDTGLAIFFVEIGEDVALNKDDGLGRELEPGDVFKLTFIAKGGGAENMSAIRMFAPAAGQQGVEDFVVETADKAGSNPCPPIVVGVGVGGNFEYSALLAKKALLRKPLGSSNPDPFYAEMEKTLLKRINNLGIGPQGMGGRCTSLAVHVEAFPCHIASMPAAVNIQCHSHRVMSFEL